MYGLVFICNGVRNYSSFLPLPSNTDYEHRRQWVEDRIHLLAEVFCIDVCAYAVMSNHLHLVLHINQQKALVLTAKEIFRNLEAYVQIYL